MTKGVVGLLTVDEQQNIIVACAVFAILFGLYNVWKIMSVKIGPADY